MQHGPANLKPTQPASQLQLSHARQRRAFVSLGGVEEHLGRDSVEKECAAEHRRNAAVAGPLVVRAELLGGGLDRMCMLSVPADASTAKNTRRW